MVFSKSQSAPCIFQDFSKNSMHHFFMRLIDLRYHWLRSITEEKLTLLNKIYKNKNIANMLNKVIPSGKFDQCT